MRVLIAGIGNVLHGDDGIGPYTVRVLESQYDFDPQVGVADLGTPGLNLIAQLLDVEALVLVDSVNNGKQPGTVSLYRRDDVVNFASSARLDPHAPALIESLKIVDAAGYNLAHLLLVGISGRDYAASLEMRNEVRQAVPGAITAVLRELDQLGITYQPKAHPSAPSIWWQPPGK